MAENNENNQENQNKDNNKPQKSKFNWANIGIIALGLLVIVAIIFSVNGCKSSSKEVTYSELYEDIKTAPEKIYSIEITPANDSSKSESYIVYVTFELEAGKKQRESEWAYLNNAYIYADFITTVQEIKEHRTMNLPYSKKSIEGVDALLEQN